MVGSQEEEGSKTGTRKIAEVVELLPDSSTLKIGSRACRHPRRGARRLLLPADLLKDG